MPVAYAVGRISVKNAQLWAEYRSRVPATLLSWGGELLLRGKAVMALCGAESHEDIVAIAFPDVQAAQGWFASPGYQALTALRSEAADVVLTIYEA
ncbi:DUF1330 domain-containing protein [Pulveribacter sp.]|uniref:DUF1330 domain-containing protein n=1 Tax=Pulveribacter sp. TaxID=2678893 RepID=UPI0028B02C71|nr:DUF1330 domain-containing protein [Pulveribacter sp.]